MRFEIIIGKMNNKAALPSDDWGIPVDDASLCVPSLLSPSSSCSPGKNKQHLLHIQAFKNVEMP